MRFSSLAIGASCLLAATASPVPAPNPVAEAAPAATSAAVGQCASGINSKINTINSQMTKVQTKVNDFTHYFGDVFQLLDIQADTLELMCDIDDATKQINSCDTLDQVDTFSVIETTFNLLPLIQKTLTTLNDKKSQFDKSILNFVSMSWLVDIDIKQLHTKTDALGSALEKKVMSSLQSSVTLTMQQIDGYFNASEAVYASHPLIS